MCIILVIYLTFWQNLIFQAVFESKWGVQPTIKVSYSDLRFGIATTVLNLEMLAYSILHMFAYH